MLRFIVPGDFDLWAFVDFERILEEQLLNAKWSREPISIFESIFWAKDWAEDRDLRSWEGLITMGRRGLISITNNIIINITIISITSTTIIGRRRFFVLSAEKVEDGKSIFVLSAPKIEDGGRSPFLFRLIFRFGEVFI